MTGKTRQRTWRHIRLLVRDSIELGSFCGAITWIVYDHLNVLGWFQRNVEAKAGSIIVFDSMLYHRGGRNTSGRPRLGINHIFVLPFIKQQIDLPSALGGKFRDDPVLGRLLGYESAPAASAYLWRKVKIERVNNAPDVGAPPKAA